MANWKLETLAVQAGYTPENGAPRVVPITVVLRADGSVAEVLPRAFESVDDLDAAVRGALA